MHNDATTMALNKMVESAEKDPYNFKSFIEFLYDNQISMAIIPCKSHKTIRFEFRKKNGSRPSKVFTMLHNMDAFELSIDPEMPTPYHYVVTELMSNFGVV